MSIEVEMQAVEAIIDRVGLSVVLSLIADICTEKANHVESNWQDAALAAQWESAAAWVDKLAQNAAIQHIS